MIYLALRNWEKFQHYKDRNPPWIKLYNSLLDDYAFTSLPDEAKWHVLASTLLASRTNNRIPADEKWISNKISALTSVKIESLILSEMFELIQEDGQVEQDASKMLAFARSREQSRAETETERERENPLSCSKIEKSKISKTKKVRKMGHAEGNEPFMRFYRAYPRRQAREDAFRAWQKALTLTDAETIIERAILYAQERKSENPKYTPLPASWLNAGRWNDEPQKGDFSDDRQRAARERDLAFLGLHPARNGTGEGQDNDPVKAFLDYKRQQ